MVVKMRWLLSTILFALRTDVIGKWLAMRFACTLQMILVVRLYIYTCSCVANNGGILFRPTHTLLFRMPF